MATKYYFRSTTASTGPAGTASTDTDTFPTVPADKNTALDMTEDKGASQVYCSGNYTTQSTPLYTLARLFVGPALASGVTLTSGAYQVGVAIRESNSNMNLYDRCFAYLWRQGSGNVKTVIAPISGGIEHGANEVGSVTTASGAYFGGNFTTNENDRIVVELWWDIRNTKNTAYTATYYYEGTTDVVDGTVTADAASFFNSPVTLLRAPLTTSISDTVNVSDEVSDTITALSKSISDTTNISELVPPGTSLESPPVAEGCYIGLTTVTFG